MSLFSQRDPATLLNGIKVGFFFFNHNFNIHLLLIKKKNTSHFHSKRTHDIIFILNWDGPTKSHHPLNNQFIHGLRKSRRTMSGCPIFRDIVSTMKLGDFKSCLLHIPHKMTWLSHCQIQCASYKTFSSLWITPETLTSIWCGSCYRSADQVSAYAHTCFCSSFLKFSSWALRKTLGSTKGSSALCFFHNLGFRYHAPYLIFTHFGLWGFCTNNNSQFH